MKKQTNEQRIVRFTKDDPMNAVFVRMAIEHFCKEVMHMDTTKQTNSLFSPMLMQDIAKDWMMDNTSAD
jgi:hypothetical protein